MRKSIWSFAVAVLLVGMPLFAIPRSEAPGYAKEFGVSLAEAERRLGLQIAAGDLDAALAAEESATFAGLWIEHKPEFRVVVRFTDEASAARLAKRVAGTPLEGLIVTRGARISLAALETQQKALRAAGNKAGATFESEIEVQANRINVFTREPEKLRATLGSAMPDSVRLERVERMSEKQAPITPGDWLTSCTTGFAVKHNSTGELGVLTAGHCSDYQYYQGVYLPYRSGKNSQSTDSQWHSTCDLFETTNVVRSPDGNRTITAVRTRANQAVGSLACKWGAETGYHCAGIGSKTYDPGSSHDATFIRMNDSDYQNGGGDSGAPWFIEFYALGVHRGQDPYGRSVYQAIDYISPLNVSVLTYNPGACTMAPYASFTYTEQFGSFNFDASGSWDPDGTIVSYTWDFGDGWVETTTSPYISHWFDTWTQYYTVVLTVTDNEGSTGQYWRTVRVCGGPGQMVCPY